MSKKKYLKFEGKDQRIPKSGAGISGRKTETARYSWYRLLLSISPKKFDKFRANVYYVTTKPVITIILKT